MIRLLTILAIAALLTASISGCGDAPEDTKTPAVLPATSHKTWSSEPKTVQEVFDRYAEAVGGRAAIERIKTRETESAITMQISVLKISAKGQTFAEAPNKYYFGMRASCSRSGQATSANRSGQQKPPPTEASGGVRVRVRLQGYCRVFVVHRLHQSGAGLRPAEVDPCNDTEGSG
jgi:hypothetical protein